MEQWGLPDLPHEVVYNILSRLPVKSLCRFKSVFKPWLALITDAHFIKSHPHQSMKSNTNHKLIVAPQYNWGTQSSKCFYSMDYQAPDPTVGELEMPWKSGGVRICGSFNGVLLLHIDGELRLWNPSIGTYQKIPPPRCTRGSLRYALGYDSINDGFKVVGYVTPTTTRDVLSMPPFYDNGPSAAHVFSSKLSSWKSIGEFHYPCCLYHGTSGSVLNGAPHWFAQGITNISVCCFLIVCFDVMEEKFKEVPTPIYEVKSNFFKLGVLDGCLCAVGSSRTKSHFDIWVMKEYGVKESWTKSFVVPSVPPNVPGQLFFEYCELLCFTKDGEVVLMLKLQAPRPLKKKEVRGVFEISDPRSKAKNQEDWDASGLGGV